MDTCSTGSSSSTRDFAETTMNELLGWYGYDKVVDREDTQGLNLQRFTSRGSPAHGRGTPTPSDTHHDNNHHDNNHDSLSNASGDSDIRETDNNSPGSGSEIAAHHQTLVTALTSNKSPSSSSKSPSSQPDTNPTSAPPGYIVCAWCQKAGLKLFTLKTETITKVFCSELCFTQCRRASFKKNKICDWCKHVRHTVNYVDFQDGEQQLQFCSNKCLNQYKMNIFCKETQEHLQLIHTPQNNPSPSASPTPSVSSTRGTGGGSTNQILITPDLWMQNGEEAGRSRRKRRRKPSSSDDMDDLEDVEDIGDRSRDSDCSAMNDTMVMEVKPDITKMAVKTEVTLTRDRDLSRGDREAALGKSSTDRNCVGSEPTRRHLKMDHSSRERLRRVRSRDSNCTPLAVTTSPGSSQMSTPPSATSGLTPPSGPVQGMPPMPMMGGLPPGMFAPPPYFYQQLMAGGGFPGALPPQGAWMLPPPPGMPGMMPQAVDPKSQTQSRQGFSRVSPTPDTSGNSSRAAPSAAAGAAPSTSGVSPPPAGSSSSGSATQQQQPTSPAKFQGPLPPPLPPGFPNQGFPGLPPGFPMPLPPGFHPAMMPAPHPTLPGGPPVTIMVPYPVMLPILVPIPIPVPIRSDKDLRDFALLMRSGTASSSTSSAPSSSNATTSKGMGSQKGVRVMSTCTVSRPASVPLKSASPPATIACSERRRCHTDDEKENSELAANCENTGSSNGAKYKIACACCQQSTDHRVEDDSPEVPCKSATNGGLSLADLGLRPVNHAAARKAQDSIDSGVNQLTAQDDVAIDLSKDKTKSFSVSSGNSSDNGFAPSHSAGSARTPPATITVKSEPLPAPLIISPLQTVGGFLMPPRDHAYSSRRSMILDAPSVPRDRNESPSPEKRLMLRSPNRDVMFAKRRCMRTRIKTK